MDTLKFPISYEDYFRLGMEDYNNENYNAAINKLEKAYKIKQTYDVHKVMVHCYQALGELDIAKKLLLEEKEQYLKNNEGLNLYFDLLCQTKEWLTANILINEYPELEDKKSQLELLEKADKLYQKDNIEILKNNLKNVGNKSAKDQISLFKQINYLTLEDFFEIAFYSLVNKNLHLLVRSHLLMTLKDLSYKEKVDFLNINNEIVEVIPEKIKKLETSKWFENVKEEIATVLEHNPVAIKQMDGMLEIVYYFLLPYPIKYIKEDIEKEFARSLISSFGLYYHDLNDENEEIKKILNKIQAEFVKLQ